MKKWILGVALTLAFSLAAVAETSGQSSTSSGMSQSDTGTTKAKKGKKAESADTGMAKETHITGCQGGSEGAYTITNGRYKKGVAVTPASGVDLKPHVGHEVKLTGTWQKTGDTETFNATKVEHISDTCTATAGAATGKGKKKKGEGGEMGEAPNKK